MATSTCHGDRHPSTCQPSTSHSFRLFVAVLRDPCLEPFPGQPFFRADSGRPCPNWFPWMPSYHSPIQPFYIFRRRVQELNLLGTRATGSSLANWPVTVPATLHNLRSRSESNAQSRFLGLARFQGGRACHVPNSSTQRREGESNSRSAHRDSLSFPSWHLTTRSSLHGGAGASRTPMADLSDQPAFEAGGLATCPTAPGAGREGIEPSYPDLEFGVLPLNERPRSGTREN